MITDSRCLHDRTRADVYMVPNLHGIIIEVASICLVRRSSEKQRHLRMSAAGWVKCANNVTYLITHCSPIRQYLPREMTTACPGPVRRRSPRMIAALEIIVFPPRIIFWGPAIVARRETLFPVSYVRDAGLLFKKGKTMEVKVACEPFQCIPNERNISGCPCSLGKIGVDWGNYATTTLKLWRRRSDSNASVRNFVKVPSCNPATSDHQPFKKFKSYPRRGYVERHSFTAGKTIAAVDKFISPNITSIPVLTVSEARAWTRPTYTKASISFAAKILHKKQYHSSYCLRDRERTDSKPPKYYCCSK